MSHPNKVLVIGGSGFIGSHLCSALQDQHVSPIVFDRVPPAIEGVEYHRGDMSTIADLFPSLVEDVDAIYHLAWTTKPASANQNPLFDLQSNVVAGVHLLDGLAKLSHKPRLIFVSSGGAIYGNANVSPIPEDCPTRPINAYGIGKLALEDYIRLYGRLFGLDYLIFRPGNPFGEGQDPAASQGAAAVFLGRINSGRPIEIWGDGSVVRDYLYVADLISALLGGLEYQPSRAGHRVFNVGSGEGLTLNQLVGLAEAVSGRIVEVLHTSGRAVDVPSVVLDTNRIRRCFGWHPRVGVEEGLRRTWRWIHDR